VLLLASNAYLRHKLRDSTTAAATANCAARGRSATELEIPCDLVLRFPPTSMSVKKVTNCLAREAPIEKCVGGPYEKCVRGLYEKCVGGLYTGFAPKRPQLFNALF
jgi:hypothetical protein